MRTLVLCLDCNVQSFLRLEHSWKLVIPLKLPRPTAWLQSCRLQNAWYQPVTLLHTTHVLCSNLTSLASCVFHVMCARQIRANFICWIKEHFARWASSHPLAIRSNLTPLYMIHTFPTALSTQQKPWPKWRKSTHVCSQLSKNQAWWRPLLGWGVNLQKKPSPSRSWMLTSCCMLAIQKRNG